MGEFSLKPWYNPYMNWREIHTNFPQLSEEELLPYFIERHKDFLDMYDSDVLPLKMAEMSELERTIFLQELPRMRSKITIEDEAFRNMYRNLLFPKHISAEMVVEPELKNYIDSQIRVLNDFSQEVTTGVKVKRRKFGHPSFLVFQTEKPEDITLQTLRGHDQPDLKNWFMISSFWGFLDTEGFYNGNYNGIARDRLTIFYDKDNNPATYHLSYQQNGQRINRPYVPWSHLLKEDYDPVNQFLTAHTTNVQKYVDGLEELSMA